MANAAHAGSTSKAGSLAKPRAAQPKAKPRARPKAQWSFDGSLASPAAAGVQTKMEVSQPGDKLEHEADRVADHVLGKSAAAGAGTGAGGKDDPDKKPVQRMAAAHDEDKKPVQRMAA